MADRICVLYVDDESTLLEISKIYLERSGQFEVDTITSAPAALTLLDTKNYDAIISDYQMPVMDGIELLKAVRSSGNTIPFILFTGRGREEIVIQALNEGADFYLQKGGEPKSQFTELSHKIKIAVERKRAVNALKQNEYRLNMLVTFYQMTSSPLKELMVFAVEQAVEITSSSIGYLAFVSDDESVLTMYTWSAKAMKECRIYKKPIEYPLETTGLWGEAVRQRRPVITNDYTAENPQKKGYPKGHVPIKRHMNIPIFDGTHIVMVAGVGNKTSAYDDQDIHELSVLMSGLWNVIKQRRAEEELIKKNEELLATYEQITASEEELRAQYDNLAQSERTLRLSEERYRNVVEDQTEFICRFLPDGTHVFANDAYCRYFGVTCNEILGHRFQPKIPAEDQERMKQFFASLTPDHPVDTIEHRIVMPDGTIRWQWWSDRAIFDSSGTIIEYQSVGRDITEQKHDELALHENEQRLTSIYNTVGDVIFQLAVEPQGQYRFTSVNSAFSRITGLPPGEVIGRKVHEIIPEPSLFLVLEKYRRAIEEKTVVRWEETSSYPTGQLTGEVSVAPIFDTAGNCTHLIGSVHDITERKRAEEVLRESEEQYRSLVETTGTGYVILDTGGRVITANHEYLRLCGRSSLEDIRGRPVTEWTAPYDLERNAREVEQCVRTGQVRGLEIDYLKPDGSFIPVEVNASVIRSESGPIILTLCRDITQRRATEKSLKTEQEFTRLLLDTSPAFFVAIGADGRTITMNRALVEVLEYTPEEIRGVDYITTFVPKEDRELLAGVFRQIAYEGKATVNENRIISKSGKTYLVEWHGRPVNHEDKSLNFFVGVGIDITERKQAEEALRESEEKYRSTIDAFPDAISVVDREFKVILANTRLREWLGALKQRNDIIGRPILDAFPFLSPSVLDEYRTVFSKGTIMVTEESSQIGDAKVVTETRKIPLKEHNDIIAVVAVIRDITNRKRDEEALRESEENFRSLAESSPDYIMRYDRQCRHTYMNPAALRVSGLSKEQILGKTHRESGFDESLSRFWEEKITRVFETGKPYQTPFEWQSVEGRVVLDWMLTPEFADDGTVLSVLGVSRDITQLKKAEDELLKKNEDLQDSCEELTATEEELRETLDRLIQNEEKLRESEEKYRGIFAAESDGLVVIDRATGIIIDCNDAFLLMYGYRKDEVIGQPLAFTSAEPDATRASIKEGITRIHDRSHKRKDGSVFPVEITTNILSLHGREVIIAATRDVSEKKLAEEALRKANKKLNLLSSVARHDINNQITVLQGYLVMLETEQSDPSRTTYLRQAETAAQRISAMIRFTKEYESIGVKAPAWQDCRTLVETATKQTSLGNISVKNDIPARTELFADPMIVRIFYNLTENAVRYGGKITTVRFSAQESGHDLKILCEDDGDGIPADIKERIFERGFGRNTGLGLFLVREILDITGITIRETGEPGKGARFEMTVPEGAYRFADT